MMKLKTCTILCLFLLGTVLFCNLSLPADAATNTQYFERYCQPAYDECAQSLCNPTTSGCAGPCISIYTSSPSPCQGGCKNYADHPDCVGPYWSSFMSCLGSCEGAGKPATCGYECLSNLEKQMESCLASRKTTSPTPVSVSTTPLTPRVPVTTPTTSGETPITTTGTQSSSLIVTVQTNANNYEVGDPFIVTVFVNDGEGYPVPGASVSLIFSESRTGFRNSASGVTDSKGEYSKFGTWSENDTGTITITGTASKTSYTGSTGSTSVAVESGPSLTGSLQAHFSASPTPVSSPLESISPTGRLESPQDGSGNSEMDISPRTKTPHILIMLSRISWDLLIISW